LEFPHEIWTDEEKRAAVRGAVDLFADRALLVTDELANTVYLSPEAEKVFGDRAEALVNRLSFSLLGFGNRSEVPKAMVEAINGEGPPWKGLVNVGGGEPPNWYLAEMSSAGKGKQFIAGFILLEKGEVKR